MPMIMLPMANTPSDIKPERIKNTARRIIPIFLVKFMAPSMTVPAPVATTETRAKSRWAKALNRPVELFLVVRRHQQPQSCSQLTPLLFPSLDDLGSDKYAITGSDCDESPRSAI